MAMPNYSNIEYLKISYSSLSTFHSCPRKFEFHKLWSIAGEHTTLDMEVGHALHAGYQAYVQTRSKQWAMLQMMLRYPWDLNTDPGNYKSCEACYASLHHLMDRVDLYEYEPVQFQNKHGKTVPAIEVGFEFTIKNFSLSRERHIPVVFGGFIDVILYDIINDEYIVIDIKTTRQKLNDYGPKYQFDDQCIPYAIMLEHVLGKEIKSLKIKYCIVYIDIAQPDSQLLPFYKTQEDIQDWAQGLMYDLNQMSWFYDSRWWPRNGRSCMNFNRPCEYLDICSSRDQEQLEKEFQLVNNNKKPRALIDPDVVFELDLGL